MDPATLESLKKHYDFEAWRGTNELGRNIERRNISLPRDLLQDLEPAQVRDIDPGDGTRLLRASWSVSGEDDGTVFVDLRECKSLDMAHQIVLELLANMQAPDVKRTKEPVGDVSFSRGDASFLIFARGNVAISIRNAGDTIVPVAKYARMIDEWIVSGEF